MFWTGFDSFSNIKLLFLYDLPNLTRIESTLYLPVFIQNLYKILANMDSKSYFLSSI